MFTYTLTMAVVCPFIIVLIVKDMSNLLKVKIRYKTELLHKITLGYLFVLFEASILLVIIKDE